MIFLAANIPMCSYGAQHPNKAVAQRLLEDASIQGERLVTSAEVLQEILHRYTAIRWPVAIQPCFDLVLGLVSEVFAVELTDVESRRRSCPTARTCRPAMRCISLSCAGTASRRS